MKRTNILLIVPPYVPMEEFRTSDPKKYSVSNISMPLGLLSICAYIRKYSKVNIDILDLNLEIIKYAGTSASLEWEEFIRGQFNRLNCDKCYNIAGISALFNSNEGYLKPISEILKNIWPRIIVTVGGGLATNMYTYVLDNILTVDAVAIGEGEKPFLGLINADNKIEYLNSASSWVTRKKLKSQYKPEHDVIVDLDEVPFLSYDLIDFKEYQKFSPYHGDRQVGFKVAHIMTSRGCPYKCVFCSSHTIHGRKLRYHSVKRVLYDIRKLKENFHVNTLLFQDDAFLFDKKRAIKILEGVAKENLTIEFPNGLSVGSIDEQVSQVLKEAGLKVATLAVESGCERVLNEIIHKPYKKLTKVKAAVENLRSKNIYTRGFFIIGFPGETMKEIQETVSFMKDAGFNWVALFIASPIVGSELYQICKDKGLFLSDNMKHFHYALCNIKLEHSTSEEMEELKYRINLEVNFVDNYDLRNNMPETALIGFRDVINRVPDHAFAHYFAAICYGRMNERELEKKHFEKYFEIISNLKQWAEYAKYYNLDCEFFRITAKKAGNGMKVVDNSLF